MILFVCCFTPLLPQVLLAYDDEVDRDDRAEEWE